MNTKEALQMVQDAMKEVVNIGHWAKNVLDARLSQSQNPQQSNEVGKTGNPSDLR